MVDLSFHLAAHWDSSKTLPGPQIKLVDSGVSHLRAHAKVSGGRLVASAHAVRVTGVLGSQGASRSDRATARTCSLNGSLRWT